MKKEEVCNECEFLRPLKIQLSQYHIFIFAQCMKDMMNNYIYQDKDENWVRPAICIKNAEKEV